MDPLRATIEEFAAEGYTHIESSCPRCRVIRLRPIEWLPRISMGLTIAQLSERLRCAHCGSQLRVRRSVPQLRSVLCRPVFCVVTSLDRRVAVDIEAEQKLRRAGEAGL
jgi:phage FluMu protein Com